MSDQPPVNVNVNPQQPSGFYVSLQDIYKVATDTQTEISGLRADVSRVLSTDADHESRLRAVEAAYVSKAQAAWAFGTFIAVVVAVTGVLALILR